MVANKTISKNYDPKKRNMYSVANPTTRTNAKNESRLSQKNEDLRNSISGSPSRCIGGTVINYTNRQS